MARKIQKGPVKLNKVDKSSVRAHNNRHDHNARDAVEADLPAIIAIYNQSIPSGRATADTHPISVDERRSWFRQFSPHKRPIWVAERAGNVVGCIYITSFYGGRPAYDKTAEVSLYQPTMRRDKVWAPFLCSA